jgi:hypothetical protein
LYESNIVNDQTNSTLEEVIGANIQILPNPASDWIKINGNQEGEDVFIFDISGKLRYAGMQSEINVSQFESGIYILRVLTKDGIGINKFIKL